MRIEITDRLLERHPTWVRTLLTDARTSPVDMLGMELHFDHDGFSLAVLDHGREGRPWGGARLWLRTEGLVRRWFDLGDWQAGLDATESLDIVGDGNWSIFDARRGELAGLRDEPESHGVLSRIRRSWVERRMSDLYPVGRPPTGDAPEPVAADEDRLCALGFELVGPTKPALDGCRLLQRGPVRVLLGGSDPSAVAVEVWPARGWMDLAGWAPLLTGEGESEADLSQQVLLSRLDLLAAVAHEPGAVYSSREYRRRLVGDRGPSAPAAALSGRPMWKLVDPIAIQFLTEPQESGALQQSFAYRSDEWHESAEVDLTPVRATIPDLFRGWNDNEFVMRPHVRDLIEPALPRCRWAQFMIGGEEFHLAVAGTMTFVACVDYGRSRIGGTAEKPRLERYGDGVRLFPERIAAAARGYAYDYWIYVDEEFRSAVEPLGIEGLTFEPVPV